MNGIILFWYIDPLIGETNKETTAIAMQQLYKHTTVLEPLLVSSPRAAM
jgi:hypothetical protein